MAVTICSDFGGVGRAAAWASTISYPPLACPEIRDRWALLRNLQPKKTGWTGSLSLNSREQSWQGQRKEKTLSDKGDNTQVQKGALQLKVRGSVQAIMSFAPLRSLYFKIQGVLVYPRGGSWDKITRGTKQGDWPTFLITFLLKTHVLLSLSNYELSDILAFCRLVNINTSDNV